MKRILLLTWCWLALGTVLLLAEALMREYWTWVPERWAFPTLAVIAVLAGLGAWLISRRDYQAWARGLGVAYTAFLTALVLAALAFFVLIGIEGFVRPWFVWVCGGAFLVGLVSGVLFCRKGVMRGIAAVAALTVLTGGIVLLMAQRQKSVIRDYEKKWADMGWTMDLKGIFPMSYSKPQCEAWFDTMAAIAPKEGKGEWKPFYDEVVIPISSEKSIEALRNGLDIRAAILSLPAAADPRWTQYLAIDAVIRTAMERCPHVQWFDPAEYQHRLWDAPIPNLLGTIKWSRGLLASSHVAAANGRFDAAQADLDVLHRGAEKMLIKGQTLIGTLIGIAMDKLSLVGEAGLLAMGGGPMAPDVRSAIENTAGQDISWFASAWKTELMASYSILKYPDVKHSVAVGLTIPMVPFLRGVIFRAIYIKETDHYLSNMTQTIQSLIEGYRPESQQFGWNRHKSLKIKESQLSPNLTNTYARALCLIAQARLVLMMDEVLKYRREHEALPENLDFVQASWRTDPFDEKPLRYKKEDDAKFVVYSVGTDGRDDGAQTLYVAGVMKMEDELKEDIGFRVALPPAGSR